MDPVFMMYAAESEGDIPTRRGKIQRLIKELAAAGYPKCDDFNYQCQLYNEIGIDSDTFTEKEINYIQKEEAKRV